MRLIKVTCILLDSGDVFLADGSSLPLTKNQIEEFSEVYMSEEDIEKLVIEDAMKKNFSDFYIKNKKDK